MTRSPSRSADVLLLTLLMLHLMLGILFTTRTPLWQVPDEPAHFNVIRHIAETGSLPVLEIGDYPADYLEEIKSQRFPPTMSIESIAYEAHQPPLYYLLATPVYLLLKDAPLRVLVHGLRILTLLCSLGALYAGYRALRLALPDQLWLARGATAIAATLPMHLTMSSGINNDALAELLINVMAWAVLATTGSDWRPRRALALGGLLGLALLTKMQSYVALAILFTALTYDIITGKLPLRRGVGLGALSLFVAGIMVAPWLSRNVAIYGLDDPLALSRHDLVVHGQLTTSEWLARVGPWTGLVAFGRTTFQSFWGQFGWMAAPIDGRIYGALAWFSGLCVLGLVLGWRRAPRARRRSFLLGRPLAIMTIWVLVTVLGYLWWNVRFVQHQGRYLFPALTPISLMLAAGWCNVHRRGWTFGALALGAGAGVLALSGAIQGNINVIATAGLILGACGLWAAHRLSIRWPGPLALLPGLGLAALSLLALWTVIVPFLSP
jgi:hypothetical protein